MSKYADDRVLSPETKPLRSWPGGKGLAVWIVHNVECWPIDYLGPGGMPWPQQPPDVPNSTFREYGNRVGVWRLIEMHDALGIPASVALNGAMCTAHPEVVEALNVRGWDIMGHGVDQSRPLNRIPPQEEAGDIDATLDAIEAFCGKRPEGWLGPGLAQTHATPDLLAARGVRYIADRLDHHQPYYVRTASDPLVAVPYSLDLNDYSAFGTMAFTGRQYAEMLTDQFDALLAESRREARVMCIPLHTYLSGAPHRSVHIARALAHMKAQPGAWITTGAEIARAFRAQT
ncbi:MAG: polysaccharide deacetylase family protein [Hyphomonadaceae bacterium]|nr:polysaccharide deacetylase family protein [Hyphomonadaceae bacterium]